MSRYTLCCVLVCLALFCTLSFEYALTALAIIVVCLPPSWDPAIRMKERNEARRLNRETP